MIGKAVYIPFSQRNGFEPIPTQLMLGEVSPDLKRQIEYYIYLEIDRNSHSGQESSYFRDWERVAADLHVIHFKQPIKFFKNDVSKLKSDINHCVYNYNIGKLFDLVEFFILHRGCSKELKLDLTNAFVVTRSAYRVIENQIIAVGTAEQGEAVTKALLDTESKDVTAARTHLIQAGAHLRNSDWPGSVRESIHAVESIACKLAPGSSTLGKALSALESKGRIHVSLKNAFGSLYGYTSDEEGIRHALVYKDAASVDEADALFMLGACASFVSYLLARET
jgi:AbiJ N-terminal domain 4